MTQTVMVVEMKSQAIASYCQSRRTVTVTSVVNVQLPTDMLYAYPLSTLLEMNFTLKLM